MRFFILIGIIGLVSVTASVIEGCGIRPAVSDDTHVSGIQANDGTWCYVVFQAGQARGVSCK